MPKVAVGKRSETAKPEAKQESADLAGLVKQLMEQNQALMAQLQARPQATSSGRTYAEAGFPREAVDELLSVGELTKEEQAQAVAEFKIRKSGRQLADIRNLFVKRIPGSPTSDTEPYGKPVLVWNKAHTTQMNGMKDGIDRENYIKLGGLLDTLQGDIKSYRSPKALTEDQINRVLRPILDVALEAKIVEL